MERGERRMMTASGIDSETRNVGSVICLSRGEEWACSVDRLRVLWRRTQCQDDGGKRTKTSLGNKK